MTEKESLEPHNIELLIDVDAPLSDRQFQRKLESYRAERDFYKHLTTLSTASVVLIATFLVKVFPNPEWKELVNTSMSGFCCLGGGLRRHVRTLRHRHRHRAESPHANAYSVGRLASANRRTRRILRGDSVSCRFCDTQSFLESLQQSVNADASEEAPMLLIRSDWRYGSICRAGNF